MEQSAFGEANRSSDGQEISRILYQPNVHYRIHKDPPPVTVLRSSTQFMPPHHNLILSSHLRLGCSSRLFPSGVHNKTVRELLYSIRATWPAYLIIFYIFTTATFAEEYRPLSPSLCSFLHSLVTSSLLGPKFYSAFYSETPSSYIPLWKWQTKFHTHTKQQTKIHFRLFNIYVRG